jgi:redox-sensitive bicupin YhaK (pirin superfamily)
MNARATDERDSRGTDADAIELVIEGRPRDLGSFVVRRMLPSEQRRLVGPFIFYDHVDRVVMPPGVGFDVRPHPHIALATITYLLEGEFVHRDSLGSVQVIRPGDVNWMIAGRGIVHSERTSAEVRERGGTLHAVQSWVALPLAEEETEPRFEHHPDGTIPRIVRRGAVLRVIAGTAYGAQAPTGVLSPTLYVHAKLEAGAVLPIDDEHEQRGVYVASGTVECQGRSFSSGALVLLRAGASVTVCATSAADLMLIGGAPLDGERHVYWNFVSSSKARIERAKADWREGRFAKVPTDDVEFIPLPSD